MDVDPVLDSQPIHRLEWNEILSEDWRIVVYSFWVLPSLNLDYPLFWYGRTCLRFHL